MVIIEEMILTLRTDSIKSIPWLTLTLTIDSIKALDMDMTCLPAPPVVILEVAQVVDVILVVCEKMASIGQTQAATQIRISHRMLLEVSNMIDKVTGLRHPNMGNLTNSIDQEDSIATSIIDDSIREQIHNSLTQILIIGLAHLPNMILDSSKK